MLSLIVDKKGKKKGVREVSLLVFLFVWLLKDSNGNLELAVAFLTAKNAKVPQQEEATYYQTALPGNDRYISVGSQADTSRYFFIS